LCVSARRTPSRSYQTRPSSRLSLESLTGTSEGHRYSFPRALSSTLVHIILAHKSRPTSHQLPTPNSLHTVPILGLTMIATRTTLYGGARTTPTTMELQGRGQTKPGRRAQGCINPSSAYSRLNTIPYPCITIRMMCSVRRIESREYVQPEGIILMFKWPM
jgi:hypothetical protein